MQGGSIAEVINATFNIDVDATIQRVYSTQTQLLQVWRQLIWILTALRRYGCAY